MRLSVRYILPQVQVPYIDQAGQICALVPVNMSGHWVFGYSE